MATPHLPTSYQQVAEYLKAAVPDTVMNLLHRDQQLQAILGVWHLVPIGAKNPGVDRDLPDPLPTQNTELAVWLWQDFTPDWDKMKVLLGPQFPVRVVFDRAASLLLLYPDGTIHPHAESYLRAAAAEVIRSFPGVRAAASDRNPDRGEGGDRG